MSGRQHNEFVRRCSVTFASSINTVLSELLGTFVAVFSAIRRAVLPILERNDVASVKMNSLPA